MPVSKPKINAYDAFALLNRDKLYPNQLHDVLVDGLHVKKVLCISDSTDVFIPKVKNTKSIAYTIEQSGLGADISVIQSDYIAFSYADEDPAVNDDMESCPEFTEDEFDPKPKFGAHLPQNQHEIRKEYYQIDATRLEVDLEPLKDVDVILGRSCLCACAVLEDKLCGGIGISEEEQKKYIQSLMKLKPILLVLSAAQATFYPEEETDQLLEKARNHKENYRQAQQNLIMVCEQLNTEAEHSGSAYRYAFVHPDANFRYIYTAELMGNGYMLVAYDASKVDFQNTSFSLQRERLLGKEPASIITKTATADVPVNVDPEASLVAQNAIEAHVGMDLIQKFTKQSENDILAQRVSSGIKPGLQS